MPNNGSGALFAAIALVICSVTAWSLSNDGKATVHDGDAMQRLAHAYRLNPVVR